MQRIYLDNAATTPIDPRVVDEMLPFLQDKFGNPSSIYSFGRETKMAIENARKIVAKYLGAKPSEIFFTSGGTESTNTAINASIRDLACERVITSPIEHHATLHTVQHLPQNIEVNYVSILPNGHIDLHDLERLLSNSNKKTLVTIMHANNEIGNLVDLDFVSQLCQKYNAILHSDAVQTVAHYNFDLQKTKLNFLSASGHKFHGPKGVGVLYINGNTTIKPYLQGGAQERNMRAGTENVYGIVGFAKALELAYSGLEQDSNYILDLKNYAIQLLKANYSDIVFNGDAEGESLYTVLNVGFPNNTKTEMLMYNLDIAGICVSGGSACSSGASDISHVIKALTNSQDIVPIRFSFSKFNTKEEIEITVDKIKQLLA